MLHISANASSFVNLCKIEEDQTLRIKLAFHNITEWFVFALTLLGISNYIMVLSVSALIQENKIMSNIDLQRLVTIVLNNTRQEETNKFAANTKIAFRADVI